MTTNDIIVLPFTENVINKTIKNTISKFTNTNSSLMYERTPIELLDNIFMGDIAKNSLIEYIRKYTTKNIIDYDDIRDDDFKNADPGWDFLVGDQKIKVEVKSSIPPKGEKHDAIINLRDIKITASHNKGQTWISPDNLESYIHVQVYFYARPYKNGPDTIDKVSEILLNDSNSIYELINLNKYNEPLFFGWATKDEIISYVNQNKDNTWTFSWTNRIYWKCPISKAHNLNELIDFINKN